MSRVQKVALVTGVFVCALLGGALVNWLMPRPGEATATAARESAVDARGAVDGAQPLGAPTSAPESAPAFTLQGDAMVYESVPDEAVIYNGLVYARDTFDLPGGVQVRMLMPGGLLPDSLVIVENGERVSLFRFVGGTVGAEAPVSVEPYVSSSIPAVDVGTSPRLVEWDSAAEGEREVVLEYLVRGVSWKPVYNMTVLDDEKVLYSYGVQITNGSLRLEGASLKLVAGMLGAEQYTPQMTAAQQAVSWNTAWELEGDVGNYGMGGEGGASVSVHHVYDIGRQTVRRGETTYINLLTQELGYHKHYVWDTSMGQAVHLIYRVKNDSEWPFAEGLVRVYQEGIYMGADYVEWTPTGSEGSITVAAAADVRVKRAETVEKMKSRGDYEYFHEVTLKLENFGDEALEITVIDRQHPSGVEFRFSDEPEEKPDNVLSWEVEIPAGGEKTVEYEFYTD